VEPLIHLRQVCKAYRLGDAEVPILKGITLDIARGELVALMGASGSGKSTLMNILGCLDRPTSGTYRLDGDEVGNLSPAQRAIVRNRKIGFVFQNFNLLARTSALDNVLMPLEYSPARLSRYEARQRAQRLLERLGLGHRLNNHPAQMSGGQQQRVAIARALINQPPLVFADEPTGSLDSSTGKEILNMFQQLNAEDGITVVLVTHDPTVGRSAKRSIRMRDGLIDESAPADGH
jgi:ABC-type lipoprotein export system ATPase subunit